MMSCDPESDPNCNVVDGDDLCKLVGGIYNHEEQTCSINIPNPDAPSSVLKGMILFFILQVLVGASSTVFGTFYNQITYFPNWWTNYIVLILSFVLTLGLYWYKLQDVKEAAIRSTISVAVIFAFCVMTGWLINWDITVYQTFVDFSREPLVATFQAMPIAALISYVLVPPSELAEGTSTGKAASVVSELTRHK